MISTENALDLLIHCFQEGTPPSDIWNWETLLELSNSDLTDVRAGLAKALVNQSMDDNVVELLVKLTKDRAPCVRVEAVDTLSEFSTIVSYDGLCACLRDSDQLVRAYAAYGVALVGKDVSPQAALLELLGRERTENCKRVMVDVYEGLYILGNDDALEKIFSLFELEDYHIKCAVLHALGEILNFENRSRIYKFTQSLDLSALPIAVSTSAEFLRNVAQGTVRNH